MDGDEPPHLDTLGPIRAAIQMVADGSASRVTVYSPALRGIVPAARQLARAAGVTLEAVEPQSAHDVGADLIAVTSDTRPAA